MNAEAIPCTQGATTAQPKLRKRAPDRITLDDICKLLKVDTWDTVEERNLDYYSQWYDPKASDEENERNETMARDEHYAKYREAVMFVADQVFDYHGLILVPVRQLKENGRPYRHKGWKPETAWEFRVKPKESWLDAASHVRETINGVGVFVFSSLREFISHGPYTPREAVLNHVGWIPDWYRVYGDGTAAGHVERRMR